MASDRGYGPIETNGGDGSWYLSTEEVADRLVSMAPEHLPVGIAPEQMEDHIRASMKRAEDLGFFFMQQPSGKITVAKLEWPA